MKKWIIEIKLKKEKYSRYYYDISRDKFGLTNEGIYINISVGYYKVIEIYFKDIEYFRIIEQGE